MKRAQQGASLSHQEEGIGWSETGPPHWDGAQFRMGRVLKVDALLSPGLVLSNELKGAPGQGMKGVDDRQDLRVVQVIGSSSCLVHAVRLISGSGSVVGEDATT
jgi:hypothetical protein